MPSTEFPATQLLSVLASGQLSAVSLVSDCLDRIGEVDDRIGAFLEVDREGALRQAEEIDERRRQGAPLGALAGLPIAIKDNLCVRGWRTSCASRMLENFRPPRDATVIERLRQADAILLGRTNLDEFAMGSSCENSAFQKTRNPWSLEHSPGGSSGGSAAAVAAGMAPLALGSDTGGSIRQPAAFCGVVGVKPTYGHVSRLGLVAFASSLDQIGPFARTVKDAALLLQTIGGHDPGDSTSFRSDQPVLSPDLLENLDRPLESLTIGIVPEHFQEGVDSEVAGAVQEALGVFRRQGATIREIHLPHSRFAVAAYYLIAPSEASSNLARYDGIHYGHRSSSFKNLIDLYEASRGEGFGAEVKRRLMIGTFALSAGYRDAYYTRALQVRRLIANDFQQAFQEVDLVLTPTSPVPPFRIGELVDDPLQMYLNDIFTVTANLSGLPAVSLPCGLTRSGLPIGLQLTAPAFAEERMLRAAQQFEASTDWHTRRPPMVSETA